MKTARSPQSVWRLLLLLVIIPSLFCALFCPASHGALAVNVHPTLLSSEGGLLVTAETVIGDFYRTAEPPDLRFRLFHGPNYYPSVQPIFVSKKKLIFRTHPLDPGFYGFAVQAFEPEVNRWVNVYESSPRFFLVEEPTKYLEHANQEFALSYLDNGIPTTVSPLEYLETTTQTTTGVISGNITVDRHVNDGEQTLNLEETAVFGYPYPLSEWMDKEIGGIIFTLDFVLDGKATYTFEIPFEITFTFPKNVYPGQSVRFKAKSYRFLGNDYLNVTHNYTFSTDHRLMVNVPYDGLPPLDLYHSLGPDSIRIWGSVPVLPWEKIDFGPGELLPAVVIKEFSYEGGPTFENGVISYGPAKLQFGGRTQWTSDAYNLVHHNTDNGYEIRKIFAGNYKEITDLWSSSADQIWILSRCPIPYVSQACALLSAANVELPQRFSLKVQSQDFIQLKPPLTYGFQVTIPTNAVENPYHLITNCELTVSFYPVSSYIYEMAGWLAFDMPFVDPQTLFDWEVPEIIYSREVASPLVTMKATFPIDINIALYGQDKFVENLPLGLAATDLLAVNYPEEDAIREQVQIANLTFKQSVLTTNIPSRFTRVLPIRAESQFVLMHSNTVSAGGTLTLNPPPSDGGFATSQAVTLTATPRAGYRFAGWEGAISGTANPAILVMNSNLFVNAKFEPILPLVTLVNPSFEVDIFSKAPGYVLDNGLITGWSAGSYMGLNPISPFAPTNNYFTDNGQIPEGRQAAFIQQDGALKQVVEGLAVGGTYRVDYFENARLHGEPGDPQLEVRMGGAVIVLSHAVPSTEARSLYAYTYRESQPFAATASEMELAFVKMGPAGLDRTVLIDDVRVVYLAAPTGVSFSLALSPGAGGTIEANPASADGKYDAGTVVTLTATPAAGYQFSGWSGDATGAVNPLTVTMTGNKSVTANFTTQGTVGYQPGLLRQIYTNIPGSAIAELMASSKYPNAPDIVDSVPTLESQYLPNDAGENYGQRLTGWLVPPTTGSYVFYLASDDAAQVFLSPDDTVVNKQLIVEETGCNPWRNWEGQYAANPMIDVNTQQPFPQRASASIPLTAGRYYYLEVLHKEGNGGDHVAVAWKLPGGTTPKNGDPPIGGEYLVFRPDTAPGLPLTLGLTTHPLGSGAVSASLPPGANGRYTNGTVLTLTATPVSGYKFSRWEGALSGTTSPATLTINGNLAVTAVFETVLPAVVLVNPSFEADTFTVIPGYVGDNGPITGWSADGAGVNPIWPFASTNDYFTDNGAIPDGRQAAFVQSDGALSQVVKGLVMGGTYRVDYRENGRLWYEGAANSEPIVEVRMGGAVIVPAHPVLAVGGSNPYTAKQSATFVATATQMELAFVKVGPLGLDRTVLIDDVRVLCLAMPQCLSVSAGKGNLTIAWDPAVSGGMLETTTSLLPPVQWTPVTGVINNQVIVPIQGTTRFYRLRY